MRPALHYTAERGWINDPHGICWVDGRYHLFHQYNPHGNEWSPRCCWGHAVSSDLVRWQGAGTALAPREGEEGCWSGATLLRDGSPTIYYTSVLADDWGHGRIAMALPDDSLQRWTSNEDAVIIDGPPPGLGAQLFRDPCILRNDGGWTMVVGVGVDDGTGLAIQYRSTDAREWTYDGILCSRAAEETDGIWTGTLWECPQLFKVGSDWALVVSVWHEHTLHYVAAAVGSYDGHTFVPERWSRLSHDTSAYAMTSFTDRYNRPCVMFWLRDDPQHRTPNAPRAGALSLPMIASIGPDRTLALHPHPDVDTLRVGPPLFDGPLSADPLRCSTAPALDLELLVGDDGVVIVDIETANEPVSARLCRITGSLDSGGRLGQLTAVIAGSRTVIPVTGERIRIVVDADIVEVFGGSGFAALRLPGDAASVGATGRDVRATLHQLTRAVALEHQPG